VVDVLDDLFGLPVTLSAVGVLEGRQWAPSDMLGSTEAGGCEVAIQVDDAARQNALNGGSVKL
jgi:hypothetical protein